MTDELDRQLDSALLRSEYDVAVATALFLRWLEQDSALRALLPDLIPDYVRALMEERRTLTLAETTGE